MPPERIANAIADLLEGCQIGTLEAACDRATGWLEVLADPSATIDHIGSGWVVHPAPEGDPLLDDPFYVAMGALQSQLTVQANGMESNSACVETWWLYRGNQLTSTEGRMRDSVILASTPGARALGVRLVGRPGNPRPTGAGGTATPAGSRRAVPRPRRSGAAGR